MIKSKKSNNSNKRMMIIHQLLIQIEIMRRLNKLRLNNIHYNIFREQEVLRDNNQKVDYQIMACA